MDFRVRVLPEEPFIQQLKNTSPNLVLSSGDFSKDPRQKLLQLLPMSRVSLSIAANGSIES